MKFLIVAVAFFALACADQAERREKWNSLSEAEREAIKEKHRNAGPLVLPKEVREKIHEKFQSMTPEERVIARGKIHEKFEKISQLPEEKQQKIQEKLEKFAAMPEKDRKQAFQAFQAVAPFMKSLPEEAHQKIKEKFEAMTPAEREATRAKMYKKAVEFSKLPEDVKQKAYKKFEEVQGKMASMTEEERKEAFEKMASKNHRERRPAFGDLPEGVRQRIEALNPDQRQQMRDNIHRRFADGAVAYGIPSSGHGRPHFADKTDEERQAMRERIEAMTPEERNELRRKFESGAQRHNPRFPRPVPSDV